MTGWEQFTALFLFFVSEDDRLDGAPGPSVPESAAGLVGQRLRMLSSKPRHEDLEVLRELLEAGR